MDNETVTISVERVNNVNFISGRLKNGYVVTALVSKEEAQILVRRLATQEQGGDKLRQPVEAEVRIDQIVGIERGA